MRLRAAGPKLKPSDRAKVRMPDKIADPFYLSAEWRAFVERLKVERFGSPQNARCQDRQCKYPDRRGSSVRLFGDHVVEIKDGGAKLDPRNVLFRCGSCHTRVTAQRRASRLFGGG